MRILRTIQEVEKESKEKCILQVKYLKNKKKSKLCNFSCRDKMVETCEEVTGFGD